MSRAQLRRARALVEGFGYEAQMQTQAGERADEVWVHVDGFDEPIRLTPGRRGVKGAVILPPALQDLAPAIDLDMRTI